MSIQPNQTAEFVGRDVARPGAGRVEIEVVRLLGGMFSLVEYWQPRFPETFHPPAPTGRNGWHWLHSGQQFLIRFVGVPSERGQGSHNCHRQVDIQQVLEWRELA